MARSLTCLKLAQHARVVAPRRCDGSNGGMTMRSAICVLQGRCHVPEFILTVLLLELTPGPNRAYVATLTLARGRRAGLLATASRQVCRSKPLSQPSGWAC